MEKWSDYIGVRVKISRQFLVFGKVQGVGFRRFVKAKVDAINEEGIKISGYVCNLADGSVRVVAQGDEEHLQKLHKILEVGTIKSEVSHIESCNVAKAEFDGFEILR